MEGIEESTRCSSDAKHSHNEDKYQKWVESLKAQVGLALREITGVDQIIYRVQRSGRRPRRRQQQQQENDPYTPRLVSIGPLHHRKRDFLYNQEEKFRRMLRLLQRTRDPVEAVEECANGVKEFEKSARRCYPEDLDMDELELVKILLFDGCFILDHLIQYSNVSSITEFPGYFAQVFQDIHHDLALLENQIPFFILVFLFHKILYKKKDGELPHDLKMYALLCFRSTFNLSEEAITQVVDNLGESPINHILDLLRLTYSSEFILSEQKLASNREETNIQVEKQLGFLQTAKSLHLAGIQIVKGDEHKFLCITFDNQNGILTIPCMSIDRSTFDILKNFIAFEQLRGLKNLYVSSFAILLNSLIKSPHDVKLLEQKGIIVQSQDETLDVLSFVSDLASEADVVYDDFKFGVLCKSVNGHLQHLKITRSLRVQVGIWWIRSRDYWDRSISVLKLDYLGNFWTLLSVFAATILLVLTALQTVYTVLGYYNQK